ncbi:NAD(+)--rifampin ADP-ribosyltransferase [Rhizobiaceae sp. 2RAB30]
MSGLRQAPHCTEQRGCVHSCAAISTVRLSVAVQRERIYVAEPTGPVEDDPNLTDKKFPGNPTLSYRSREPLRVTAEVTNGQGHPPEQQQQMKDGLARLTGDSFLEDESSRSRARAGRGRDGTTSR